MLEAWFAHYPNDERNAFIASFRSRSDRQHRGAFFELCLHELLRKLGYEVHVHPSNPTEKRGRPDFFARSRDGSTFYLEATVVSDVSDEEQAAESRKNVVYDALNRLGSIDFFLKVEIQVATAESPSTRQLRAAVSHWLADLDVEEVARTAEAKGFSALPTRVIKQDGWEIEFGAIPKAPKHRGNHDVRLIGLETFPATMKSDSEAIRSAITAKANKYGRLPAPLVVAIALDPFVKQDDVVEALFGSEAIVGYRNAAGGALQRQEFVPNGAWTSVRGPRNTRVSAAMTVHSLYPWSLASSSALLYTNPWARHEVSGVICSLPKAVVEDERLKRMDGLHPRIIFDLEENWPN